MCVCVLFVERGCKCCVVLFSINNRVWSSLWICSCDNNMGKKAPHTSPTSFIAHLPYYPSLTPIFRKRRSTCFVFLGKGFQLGHQKLYQTISGENNNNVKAGTLQACIGECDYDWQCRKGSNVYNIYEYISVYLYTYLRMYISKMIGKFLCMYLSVDYTKLPISYNFNVIPNNRFEVLPAQGSRTYPWLLG